ncbi:hypothetical protein JYU34_022671 [Plutella xylostella]|uniref:Reverse transcriptase domain-containing protein n=1 Tax=Plutella xylostella TaxID=51655 RepID=A0ABQ7PPL3_PLUXY|nr:hypothetical protein JYU34_022671 [Plutella xylostella]
MNLNYNYNSNFNECFSLVSFNCKSVKRSMDDVRDLCKNFDLVALQEHWLFPHDLPLLGTISNEFDYTGKSAVDTSAGLLVGRPHGGVAILWRKGIFDSVTVLECSSVRLAAIRATIGERSIVVVTVYMPTDSSDNLPLYTELLAKINAIIESDNIETVFVLGDFNAHPHEPFHRELSDFCGDQSWVCADIEKLGIDSGSYTFVSEAHGCRRWLDHFVVSISAWQTITDVGIVENVFVSDHLPIFAKCDFRMVRPKIKSDGGFHSSVIWRERDESQITKYRQLCNSRLRDIDFPTEFTECSRGLCNLAEHRHVLDKLYSDISSILCVAAVESSGERVSGSRKGRHLCGWNKHVHTAHAEARLSFETWVLCKRPTSGVVFDEMSQARKVFKSRLKWCQNNQDQLKMDILAKHRTNKNFGKFWKATGKQEAKPGLAACVDGKNEPTAIANMFRTHFKVQSLLGLSPSQVPAESVRVGKEKTFTHFTAGQVTDVLRKMTGGKSPGHDGLSVEHLKYAGVHLPRVLALLFTMCISHSYLPEDLTKTIVVPIVKNRTGDISDRGNYRPISLATIVAKVLDGLLDSCLQKHLNLHDAQFGFRSGLSTESAILSLKHAVQYYTKRSTPVYACFLDLSKAFDLVSYDVLWGKLGDRGVPVEIISMFQYWYSSQSNYVRWAGSLSEPYVLDCGVRQGGLTSPKLFNVYVNDLIVGLSGTRVGCSIGGVSVNNLSYADDMVLLSPTVGGLRELLAICERYAAEHGLAYNVRKCEYIVFGAPGKCQDSSPYITLNGKSIKRVNKFKYLGHVIAEDLKDDADIERERRALAIRGNMLVRRFYRCSEEVKLTLFKAYCQSFYTGSLWVDHTKRSLDILRIQYNNIFRMLLGLPRFCSASGMFAEYQTDGFHAIIRKKTVSLINRVRDSHNSILKTVADDLTSSLWKCLVRRVI